MTTEQLQQEARVLHREMSDDIKRYPLPICFDPHEEQRSLYRREMNLREIAERFVRLKKRQSLTNQKGE